MEKLDFLSIGDITSDSFIRIKDASVHCELDRKKCQICMSFGEKVPFESADTIPAVGNAPNASVCASRLGLSTAVVTNLGDDRTGEDCMERLIGEKVMTNYVATHHGLKTNHHYVIWYDDERTILVNHVAYPYALPKLPEATWVYFTSLGANSDSYHQEVLGYLNKYPETKLAFQPGTFQIKMGKEKLAEFYQRADLVAVNAGEARAIIGKELSVPDLLKEFHALGSKLVLITDGRQGAHLSDGTNVWHLPIYPDPNPPVERTGAGDAMTSTLVSFLSLLVSSLEAFKRGAVNSRCVVQEIGAQKGLMTREKIEETLAKAPPGFKEEKL